LLEITGGATPYKGVRLESGITNPPHVPPTN
jgi:hypothetical protein